AMLRLECAGSSPVRTAARLPAAEPARLASQSVRQTPERAPAHAGSPLSCAFSLYHCISQLLPGPCGRFEHSSGFGTFGCSDSSADAIDFGRGEIWDRDQRDACA